MRHHALANDAGFLMGDFVYRDTASFDFSKARTYRKIAALAKSQVEVAAVAQGVVTCVVGKEETRNMAMPGDRIVTGTRGERYVIKENDFRNLYEEDPTDQSQYISKNVRRAIVLKGNVEITAPWGETMRGGAGDFVTQSVANPADVYLINAAVFKTTYALITASRK